MDFTRNYQLFLFDLDGLLVNSEELHYRAYCTMLKQRGFDLPWDFAAYFQIAQQAADAPQRAIYKEFPMLQQMEPNWQVLYAEKKEAYKALLQQEPVPLLPGVEPVLRYLQKEAIQRCVVTHTARALVDIIRAQNPLLNTIEHWFCREDYSNPKPSPDGYLKAIATLADASWNIIGFEDSFRGMQSLMGTRARPVVVNSQDSALRARFQEQGISALTSLEELFVGDFH